ncbi:MAG TPA: phosphate ABC transporter substrate-binding protein [Verrucomicrobiae bacterium]|nr:phosphate ABC transporter substrate-binding protein [Verrucomicrobiae bacterium]
MRLLKSVGVATVIVLMAGCSESKPEADTALERQKPGPGSKVVIRGSNTFGEELGPRLIAEYRKDHPATDFDLMPKATGYGMAALIAGQCDIAGASRMPSVDELEVAKMKQVELNDYVVGAYGVAVVVNGNNPVGTLTTNQVRDIFTGVILNWKDVGGADAPIHLYVRDPVSGTYLGFRELAMENKPYGQPEKLFTNYDGIVQAVGGDPDGIGYSSLGLDKSGGVKPVSIGGVQPGVDTVNKHEYPYARTIHLYTTKGDEAVPAHDFIEFVESPKGQEVVQQVGFVPHS